MTVADPRLAVRSPLPASLADPSARLATPARTGADVPVDSAVAKRSEALQSTSNGWPGPALIGSGASERASPLWQSTSTSSVPKG